MATLIEIALIVASGLSLLYWLLLPRAIPGIPYNKDSKRSVLGDLPKLVKFSRTCDEPFKWMATQCMHLQSPIIQVWLKPLQGPSVVLSDFRETQDVLNGRTKEFDRSQLFADLFANTMPHSLIRRKTDEVWKTVRRHFMDATSPSFVTNVAAPYFHLEFIDLVKLWQRKRYLAQGRPIAADEDFYIAIFDAIWGATFGKRLHSTERQLQALPTRSNVKNDAEGDPVTFPHGKIDPLVHAVDTVCKSSGPAVKSPFPKYHHWLICQLPSVRSAKKIQDQAVAEALASSRAKFASKAVDDESEVNSATDLVLRRQEQAISRGQHLVTDDFLKDELMTFIVGGHDTTASTVSWALKYMTNDQVIQKKLRACLETALRVDRTDPSEAIIPSCKAIMETSIPYLDAVIEETIRHSLVASGISREAMVDTEILGYPIPKGTEVFFPPMGPGYLMPPLPVDENLRTASSREMKDNTGEWELDGISEFMPERWLVRDEKGNETFNPRAGPNIPFGGGVRGCFAPANGENISPTLLAKARSVAVEHEQVSKQLSENFSSSLAKRLGQLRTTTDALKEWDKLQESRKELNELLRDPSTDTELRTLAAEDLESSDAQFAQACRSLTASLIPPHPFEHLSCLIELRPGAGGSEAAIFAADLLRMYRAYCSRNRLRCSLLKYEDAVGPADPGGSDLPLTEAIVEVESPGAYGTLRSEAGVHRVQRVPATEAKGRVHTSAVSVMVLPSFPSNEEGSGEAEDFNDPSSDYYIDPKDVRTDIMRARGAGGQHVNTTDSAVRLTHLPTNTVVAIQDLRSQQKNRDKAWKLLRSRLAQSRREAREEEMVQMRRSVLGVAKMGRGDKIRTYNYGQQRVTDHRSGLSVHDLNDVVEGGETLEKVMDSVRSWFVEQEVKVLVIGDENTKS
ncbi:MAG: hypothetical protein M1821_007299 [Bathelium mastoideum]|nr:MAG: hypothetical protein M1821_007299 [Bathelium mastoideum]